MLCIVYIIISATLIKVSVKENIGKRLRREREGEGMRVKEKLKS